MPKPEITLFWFRRDLRFEDNTALYYALREKQPVLPLFIFDTEILDKLEDRDDARVSFLHDTLGRMRQQLSDKGGSLLVKYGRPVEVFRELMHTYSIGCVYTNRDYEPYARQRDKTVEASLGEQGIPFYTFKDQVIFEKDEVLSGSGSFYKVFTPYKRAWLDKFSNIQLTTLPSALRADNWYRGEVPPMPSLQDMGFEHSAIEIPAAHIDESIIGRYDQTRNFPAKTGTTRLGIHLRFGTISIRQLVQRAMQLNETYLSELIWREFYSQILYHNPQVVEKSFKPEYDNIPWRNDEADFQRWCEGQTGYPIVDAGMRELNTTGYMHNRVRMIVASFLTKHLLIDWRWGEAYFARKLLDFELSSNNGGWQWAAGTGVDAQPYFRVFNPYSQTDKFDKQQEYIRRWVPEVGTEEYPEPMVDHKMARQRALDTYKSALGKD
jgi:deoxyribodipyrimidine photo-lyase